MFAGPRVALLVAITLPAFAHADAARPLVSVGKQQISVAQAQARMQRTSFAALAELGSQQNQVLERFVDEQLVGPALLEEAARARLETDESFRAELKPKLDYALQRAVERQLSSQSEASPEQIEAFYNRHKKHYERPQAIRLWRILLKDAELAKKIIVGVQGQPDGAARFRAYAREHSLDTATKLRGGDLGFALPTGHTDVPQVRVDQALVAAASKLKDGQLAPAPIPEGDYLAVLWRRGTRPAVSTPLKAATKRIAAIVTRDLAREKLGELVGQLRTKHLVEGDLALLESIKYPKPSIKPIPRGARLQHAATGSPAPTAN